jgi:hypothetical protein
VPGLGPDALEGSRFIRWQDLRVGAKEPVNRCLKNVLAGGSRKRLLMCHAGSRRQSNRYRRSSANFCE